MLILFIVEHFNLFFQALFLNIFNYYLSLAHYHYLPYWFLDKSVFSVAHANSFRRIIKGTHSVYFSSSLYIINQKHMIPRTHFHGLHALLGGIRPCICLFCGFCLLARWRYYPVYISILIARPDCAL